MRADNIKQPRWLSSPILGVRQTWSRKQLYVTLACLVFAAWCLLQLVANDQHGGIFESTVGCSQGFGTANNVACQARKARQQFDVLRSSQSTSVGEAVREYRRRYRRSPPPLFEEWVMFALHHNSTIIDDYDTIDEDMAPFRAMDPAELRRRVDMLASGRGKSNLLEVRGGQFVQKGHAERYAALDQLSGRLPDFVLPINGNDEPAMLAGEHDQLARPDALEFTDVSRTPSAWDLISTPCHYRSTTRRRFLRRQQNWLSHKMDICKHPELHLTHGALQSPNAMQLLSTRVPYVGISKLSTTSDMRAPPYLYFMKQWRSANNGDHLSFADKKNKLYWRGSTTGLYPTLDNWRTGHRHRFVIRANNLMNTTEKAEYGSDEMPSDKVDVKFSSYTWCREGAQAACDEEERVLGVAHPDRSSGSFGFKYVFDLDGNGISGRYYRLLDSNSAVFKQTILYEWHDERLIPWLHYIPISMSMQELPAVLNYFTSTLEGQQLGEEIAYASKAWAQQSLRTVDMNIYWYRFLLEYASLF